MTYIRRLLRRAERGEESRTSPDAAGPEATPVEAPPPRLESPLRSPPAIALPTCPYCAIVLDPPPARNRLCPGCRQPIVVRRVQGRLVLLVDAALPVFERERIRTADEHRWVAERRQWLKLAEHVHVPARRRSRLAKAEPTAASVDAARDLYLAAAERAVRAAARQKRWADVALIRRPQAAALYQEAGAPVPPPEIAVSLHREGMLAELRAMTDVSQYAELVGARCCPACRAEDGRVFRIAAELDVPRLPHDGCPKGICGCDWWLAIPDPTPTRARRRRKVPTPSPDAAQEVTPTPQEVPPAPQAEGPAS